MSQAVVHNGIVYLSGQVDGTADDVTGQTKNVLAKVDKYLQEAGTDKSKLLTSTIWLKDIGRDFGAMNEVRFSCRLMFICLHKDEISSHILPKVWNSWIDPNNKPARATTEASMATPKFLVEIQVTAALK